MQVKEHTRDPIKQPPWFTLMGSNPSNNEHMAKTSKNKGYPSPGRSYVATLWIRKGGKRPITGKPRVRSIWIKTGQSYPKDPEMTG